MRLPREVHENDLVRCDVHGDRFWAQVTGVEHRSTGDSLVIESLVAGRPLPVRDVEARQVIGYWRKLRGSVI